MIFITTGSRSFQFNRLLKAVDDAIGSGAICEEVFAQIGTSDYQIKNYSHTEFLNHEQFNEKLNQCDMVLTHGGTGVIVNAVKMGRRVVAVPRLEEYHEAVDDHQLQLVKAFEAKGMVTGCYDCAEIAGAIQKAKKKVPVPYESNTQVILDSIEDFMEGAEANDSDKTRILMCGSARKEKGGMNSVIDQLMDHNWDNGLRFSYLATHISGNPAKKAVYFLSAYRKLRKLLQQDTFDIAHLHMSYKGSFYRKYYVAKACKKYNKKVIIHLHGSEFKDFYHNGDAKRKQQIEELFTLADVTVALGEQWKEFLLSIVPHANVQVINNAVSIPAAGEKKIRDKRTFLFMGALIQRKGVMDLLHAVTKLVAVDIKNIEVLIAGTGPEEQKLKVYTRLNHLENYVNFLGWVSTDDRPKLLQRSDVLVLPSYNEGLPMAILEAMSYGLPVISTTVGSISEAVREGQNGCLAAPGDVDALAEYMKNYLQDAAFWKKQAAASREIAENQFSDSVFFEKMSKLYLSLAH